MATCQGADNGVYKFVYGATAAQRTVLRSATDLLLDAMREFDESQRDSDENTGQDRYGAIRTRYKVEKESL